MRLIDTHSHLYEPEFDVDRSVAVDRAVEAGVEKMMFPAIDSSSHGRMIEMCREYDNCLPMMGLHPTSVNDGADYRREMEIVEKELSNPSVERYYGIGEVGIDLYWSRDWQREQTEVFERQIELSVEYGLPLVIHTREAWKPLLESLGKYRGRGIKGIMHAFSGSIETFREIERLGDFMFGIGGVVTYKNSGLPKTVEQIPLERIVLETDCPYLTPVPFRGKRNESSYLPYICRRVAEVKGLTDEQVAAQTSSNAERVFALKHDCSDGGNRDLHGLHLLD